MKKVCLMTSLVITSIILAGCSSLAKQVVNGDNMKMVKETEISESVVGAKKIDLINEIGVIKVKATKEEKIDIQIRTEVRGPEESKLQEIHDNMKVLLTQEDETITIRVVSKGKPQKSFIEWMNDTYKGYSANVDLDISIPDTVESHKIDSNIGSVKVYGFKGDFDIRVNIGDIEGENLSGKFNLNVDIGSIEGNQIEGIIQGKVNIGDIQFDDLKLNGDTTLKVDTGTISTDIIGLEGTNNVNLSTDIGDIKLKLAENLSYAIETKGNNDKTKTETVNGGDTKIKAKVDIGDIKIRN